MTESPISFKDRILKKKNAVRILLLGDYSKDAEYDGPEDICISQLENLKLYLKERGFYETYLVKDFEDENEIPEESYDEHFLAKSRYYIISWAEILVFVFLKEGDNQSVGREWAIMIESCPEKCKDSILLNHEEVPIRALLRADISGNQISHDTFNSEETLQQRAYNLCFVKLYNIL